MAKTVSINLTEPELSYLKSAVAMASVQEHELSEADRNDPRMQQLLKLIVSVTKKLDDYGKE